MGAAVDPLPRPAVAGVITADDLAADRITRRRPLVVEAGGAGTENVLPLGLGLPEWLK